MVVIYLSAFTERICLTSCSFIIFKILLHCIPLLIKWCLHLFYLQSFKIINIDEISFDKLIFDNYQRCGHDKFIPIASCLVIEKLLQPQNRVIYVPIPVTIV